MRRNKTRSRAELEQEVNHLELKVRFYRTQGLLFSALALGNEALRAVRVVGPWACSVFIARALAGKTTVTNISGRMESESFKDAIAELARKQGGLASLCILSIVLAVVGFSHARRQVRRRQDVVQRLDEIKRRNEQP